MSKLDSVRRAVLAIFLNLSVNHFLVPLLTENSNFLFTGSLVVFCLFVYLDSIVRQGIQIHGQRVINTMTPYCVRADRTSEVKNPAKNCAGCMCDTENTSCIH